MDWTELINKTVSVLIVGKDDKTENYMGIIKNITDDDFMILDTNNPDFIASEIIFKTNLIKSVWVYKPNITPKCKHKG